MYTIPQVEKPAKALGCDAYELQQNLNSFDRFLSNLHQISLLSADTRARIDALIKGELEKLS
jgi:2-methylaconitate cis-trans-isomerase PrpF